MPTKPLQFDRTFKPEGINVNEAAVEYNGFKFPPALRSNVRLEPVYDDSERVIKFWRLHFHIEFFLFHGLNLGETGTFLAPAVASSLYGSGNFNTQNNAPDHLRDATHTTDEEMNYVRIRLGEPGQEFRFRSQGIGYIHINNTAGNVGGSAGQPMYDMDNGPKPRLVTWTPLTNKCCRVVWEITCAYTPCQAIEFANVPEIGNLYITQFPFSVKFKYDERGLCTRTITGTLGMPVLRKTDITAARADGVLWDDFDLRRRIVTKSFPRIPRFQRAQDYDISEDRTQMKFTLTDTQIDSDEAFGEGIADARVKLSSSNERSMVFTRWNTSLNGTIDLLPGYPKSYAMAEISRIFNKIVVINGALGSTITRASALAQAAEEGTSENIILALNASTLLLTNIEFTDELFGRSVGFSFNWVLTTTLESLFKATGLFKQVREGNDPAATAALQNNQWDLWRTSLGLFLDKGGFHDMNFTHDDDIIVSLCTPWTRGTPTPYTHPSRADEHEDYEDGGVPPEPDSEERSADTTWATFEPQFELEIVEHGSIHSPLGLYAQQAEEPRNPNNARMATSFSPHAPSTPDPNQICLHHSLREPTYLLHFSGYAVRANHPIPEPSISSYGYDSNNQPIPVRRVGRSVLRPRFLGTGINVVDGKSLKVYGLMWHKTYALREPPSNAKITSDAHRDIFPVG